MVETSGEFKMQLLRRIAKLEAAISNLAPIQVTTPLISNPPTNIYINRNREWASRQMVSPAAPRAAARKKTGCRCPKCGSADTRLSSTRGIGDVFMLLLNYSAARCRECDTRFRIPQTPKAAVASSGH